MTPLFMDSCPNSDRSSGPHTYLYTNHHSSLKLTKWPLDHGKYQKVHTITSIYVNNIIRYNQNVSWELSKLKRIDQSQKYCTIYHILLICWILLVIKYIHMYVCIGFYNICKFIYISILYNARLAYKYHFM